MMTMYVVVVVVAVVVLMVKLLYWAEICTLTSVFYTVSQKTFATFLTVSNYQIMIVFGTNIPETTCHQNDRSVSHLAQCMLLQYPGKSDQAKYVLK